MAWINFKKAFDCVPYEWILKVPNILKISPVIIKFLKYNTDKWHTNLSLIHKIACSKTNTEK